jgi:hypothetical protein
VDKSTALGRRGAVFSYRTLTDYYIDINPDHFVLLMEPLGGITPD